MKRVMLQRSRLAVEAVLLLLIVCQVGCGGGDPRGQRSAVEGKVTLDGKPVSAARILFISEEGDAGSLKASGVIQNGAFSISEDTGPVIGKNRVEIHPQVMEIEELEAARKKNPRKRISADVVSIPAKYGSSSELTADVKADAASNQFTFELKTR